MKRYLAVLAVFALFFAAFVAINIRLTDLRLKHAFEGPNIYLLKR